MPPLVALAVGAGILLGAIGEVDAAQGAVVTDTLQRVDDLGAVGRAGFVDGLCKNGDRVIGFHRIALDDAPVGLHLIGFVQGQRLLAPQVRRRADALHESEVAVRHVLPVGLALEQRIATPQKIIQAMTVQKM